MGIMASVHVSPIVVQLRQEHPIIQAGAAAAVLGFAGGLVHYVATGPGQAAYLVTSPWHRGLTTHSCRQDLVKCIQDAAWSRQRGQYVVVMGDKGNGKSTAIATAFANTVGLVDATIPPAATYKEVLTTVMCQIAGTKTDPRYADRVLFWYRLLTGGCCPLVVVLHASERLANDSYSQLPGPVRELADHGHIVVVDASPNSIPPELLTTRREHIIQVDSMSDNEFEQEFMELLSMLNEFGYDQLVRRIMGNVPAEAVRLESDLARCNSTDCKIAVIENYVKTQVAVAIDLAATRVEAHPPLEDIVKGFQNAAQVAIPKCFKLDDPDKLLRKVLGETGEYVFVPASLLLQFVFFHGLKKRPPMDELKKLAEKELPSF